MELCLLLTLVYWEAKKTCETTLPCLQNKTVDMACLVANKCMPIHHRRMSNIKFSDLKEILLIRRKEYQEE